MKKEILTVCKSCNYKRKLIPREYAHPVRLAKIIMDCDTHRTEDSIDIYLDKWGREIDPKSGRVV